MNISVLAGLIFVAVFGIVILIHEIGHFAVGRFFKVEIEEFGIGIPPRMLRFWWGKGFLLINGQRLEIPSNFNPPFDWRETLNQPSKITADKVKNQLILRTIEVELEEDAPETKTDHILVKPDSTVVASEPKNISKLVKVGEKSGELSLEGNISEVHPGTEFTLNWLPFGGFNRFKGEDSAFEASGGFSAAKPSVRLAILMAGATMNLLLGILVYSIIISQMGIPNFDVVQLFEVTPGSPAAQAGFRVDDIILEIDGEAIKDDRQLRTTISNSLDEELSFTIQRGDEIIETFATPLSSRSISEGAMGFLPGYAYEESPSFFTTLIYATQTTALHAREILLMPARMIRGNISPEEGRFIGFKGIFNIFQQTVDADLESRVEESSSPSPSETAPSPTFYTLNLIASLTITLGVFNLLPFPALDGGRIFFLLPELLFKKRVPPKLENLVHGVGMMLLLGLMLYINVMDFVNPVDIALP